MKKGILIIGLVWLLVNVVAFILFGKMGMIISTFSCGAIIWFGRKKLSRLLNI